VVKTFWQTSEIKAKTIFCQSHFFSYVTDVSRIAGPNILVPNLYIHIHKSVSSGTGQTAGMEE